MIWTGRTHGHDRRSARAVSSFFWLFLAFLAGCLGEMPLAMGQLEKNQEPNLTALPLGTEQITAGRVTATISFLASDELAGRETNSKELKSLRLMWLPDSEVPGLRGEGPTGVSTTRQKSASRESRPIRFCSKTTECRWLTTDC